MKVTIGRIVQYNTTEEERKKMEKTGNVVNHLPAVVTNVFGDVINVKVFADGEGEDIWKTSIAQGDNEGEWNWFPKV